MLRLDRNRVTVENLPMPFLSVVLPTLNRPDTLRHALATMTGQVGASDCEFIIQNNGGNGEIAAMVDALGDPRFKHFATDSVITMTENWEAALGHATGEYVTFIGDDDGLMPDGCAVATRILESRTIDLLSWRSFTYYWPGYYHPAFRNLLDAEIDFSASAERLASRSELALVYGFQAHYSRLPMIYNSFVRRSVIERMRAICGRYFIGYSPDVTSGIANAALTHSFVRLSRPIAMAGLSAHSTGHTTFFEETDGLGSARGRRDFGTIEGDPQLPDLNALSLFLARDMLRLKQLLFAHDGEVSLSFKGLAQATAADINDRPELYDRTLRTIRDLAAMHDFDITDLVIPPRRSDRPVMDKGVRATGAHRVHFKLDGAALGLGSIADAVRVVSQFVPDQGALDLADIEAVGRLPLLDGDGLDFVRGGGGVAALVEGWSNPEEWGTWSIAKSCTLRFAMRSASPRRARINLACRAFVSDGNPVLRVTARVGNGTPQDLEFSTESFAGVRALELEPAAIAADGTLTVSFALTNPRSPADLALGPDVRPLGIGIERIWLSDE
jgi:hypothetical protein